MRVKPKPGLIVRQPTPPHAPLPTDGANVPESSYWLRRLKEGSIEKIEKTESKPARRRSAIARESDE